MKDSVRFRSDQPRQQPSSITPLLLEIDKCIPISIDKVGRLPFSPSSNFVPHLRAFSSVLWHLAAAVCLREKAIDCEIENNHVERGWGWEQLELLLCSVNGLMDPADKVGRDINRETVESPSRTRIFAVPIKDLRLALTCVVI